MQPLTEVDLVEKLLAQQTPKFSNVHLQMIWQRGFLTGLLARFAHNDSHIREAIWLKTKK
jgi:hypothetical protein